MVLPNNTTGSEVAKSGVPDGTPAVSTGVPVVEAGMAGGTSGDDVAKLQADLKAKDLELERIRLKFEKDMDNLRSSLQKDSGKRVSDLSDRLAQTQRERDEIAMKGMDDAQRAVYERNLAQERADAAEDRAEELEASLKAQVEYQNTVNYFRKEGIPDSALDFTDTQTLATSAWKYMKEKSGAAPAAPAAPNAPKTPEAPAVLTTGQGTPATKKTRADLIKEMRLEGEHPDATLTRIYEGIADGTYSASILPV